MNWRFVLWTMTPRLLSTNGQAIRGCGAQYFSQQAVFRLAPEAGIKLDQRLGPAQQLKSVQEMVQPGDEPAMQIFETIGCYVGYGIANYADFYELRNVLILGRVTSGEGGNIILNRAQHVLETEFPELAENVKSCCRTKPRAAVGQAVAAASLPAAEVQWARNASRQEDL